MKRRHPFSQFMAEILPALAFYALVFLVIVVALRGDAAIISAIGATGFFLGALLAGYFAWLNLENGRAKRRDDLFDRRHDYFWRLWEHLLETHSTTADPNGERGETSLYWREFEGQDKGRKRLAVEARFLFGPATQSFVKQLHERDPIRVPVNREEWQRVDVPEWLVDHFSSYLTLEK